MRTEYRIRTAMMVVILSMFLTITVVSAGQSASTQRRRPAPAQPQPEATAPRVDSAPSETVGLDQTIKWLLDTITTYSIINRQDGDTTYECTHESVKVEDCSISFLRKTKGSRWHTNTTVRIPLRELDSNVLVKLDTGKNSDFNNAFLVMLKVTNNQKLIRFSKEGTHSNGEGLDDSISIPFDDERIAARTGKAFTHLINLCKNKKEPF